MNRVTQLCYSSHFLFHSSGLCKNPPESAKFLPREAVRAPGSLHSESQCAMRAIPLQESGMVKSDQVRTEQWPSNTVVSDMTK